MPLFPLWTLVSPLLAPLKDVVYFGSPESEQQHAVRVGPSSIIRGGLGQPARTLLPFEPNQYKGGALSFTVKVDPTAENYVTVKFWGSDRGEASGRILLYSGNHQIGYRDQGDYDVVNQIEAMPTYPGRFLYVTLPLPPSLTKGKSRIELTLLPVGVIYPYGATFAQRQKPFFQASRGIYAAYTSTSPNLEPPATEAQGSEIPPELRPSPGPETMALARNRVNDFARKLATSKPKSEGDTFKDHAGNLFFLASAYVTPWTSAYQKSDALKRIVAEGDAYARLYERNPKALEDDWLGAGPLGWAIVHTLGDLRNQGFLDPSRRRAWADVLEASVKYWQSHRRFFTNQSMIVDFGVYAANEGLRKLDPARTIPEKNARRFLYESIGLEPWRGNVSSAASAGNQDLPANALLASPFGETYSLVTAKGLGKELGFVSGYGETILHFVSDMVRLTKDPRIKGQLVKMMRARAPFRYPLADLEGYRAMVIESAIDNRNGHYPGHVAYGPSHGSRESEPLEVAVLTKDPVAIGMAQQELNDNQYFTYIASHLTVNDPYQIYGLLTSVDNYEGFPRLKKSAYRLPMTDGQPDFIWADEENAVVALKHGQERLYFNFYYRSERGINGLVRIHHLSPQFERMVTARSQFEFTSSGETYVRPDGIDIMRGPGLPPPGEDLHQAWAGERMPIQKRPEGAQIPKYGDWGPFVGKADFYTLRYGKYLLGVNTTFRRSYSLPIPDADRIVNLATRKTVRGKSLTVPPLTTAVLFIEKP